MTRLAIQQSPKTGAWCVYALRPWGLSIVCRRYSFREAWTYADKMIRHATEGRLTK